MTHHDGIVQVQYRTAVRLMCDPTTGKTPWKAKHTVGSAWETDQTSLDQWRSCEKVILLTCDFGIPGRSFSPCPFRRSSSALAEKYVVTPHSHADSSFYLFLPFNPMPW
jgi:hypothetical protein